MWLYNNKEVTDISQIPDNAVGFIYMIVNPETGNFYFGKKSLYSSRTLPALKGQKRKRKVTKESNWLSYQSSNSTVKSWNSPHKEIIEYCYTQKMLTVRELQVILCMNGLEDSKCLNDNVLGKIFRGDFEKEKEIKNGN